MKPILIAFTCLLAILSSSYSQAKKLSEMEVRNQALKVAKQYAQSITCDYSINPNNLIALTPPTYDSVDYSTPEYVLIWSGDVGCYGGSHSIRYLITTINVRAANTATVDPLLSSPAVQWTINPNLIKKMTRISNNSLKIIATDETESNVEIRLKRDAKGQWRVTQNKDRN